MKRIISQQETDAAKVKLAKKYIIHDNPNVSEAQIACTSSYFIMTYVPCFGKYEIEKFVGDKMIDAIFETKDITKLFLNDIYCDDFPFKPMKVSGEEIKRRVLKCFEKVGEDKDNIYIMFKWISYENIEKGE